MAGMSKLKRDLVALNNQKNGNHQTAPQVRASRKQAVNTTATVSKSNSHPTNGGSAKYAKKQVTGSDRSPVKAPAPVAGKSSGVRFYKKHLTGKDAPQGKGGITGAVKRQLMP